MRAIIFGAATLLIAVPALSQNPGVDRAQRFIVDVVPVCVEASSVVCYDRAFERTDRNGDAFLSLAELEALKSDLRGWTDAYWTDLNQLERNGLTFGFFMIDAIGLAPLFDSYDANRDDLLSRDELSADVSFDERPLDELIRDRNAIDWRSLRGRLGHLSPALAPYVP